MNPETRDKLWLARHGSLSAMGRSHAQSARMLLAAKKRLVALPAFYAGKSRKEVNGLVHKITGGSPASPMMTALSKVIVYKGDPYSMKDEAYGHLCPTQFELDLLDADMSVEEVVQNNEVMFDGLGRLVDWKASFRPEAKRPVEPIPVVEEPVLEKEPEEPIPVVEEPVLTDEEIQAKLDEFVVAKPVTTNGLTWPEIKEMIAQGSSEESLFELAIASIQGNVDGFLVYLLDQAPTLYDDIEKGLEDRSFSSASKTKKAAKVFEWMGEEGWGQLRFTLPDKKVGVVRADPEPEPEIHFVEEPKD